MELTLITFSFTFSHVVDSTVTTKLNLLTVNYGNTETEHSTFSQSFFLALNNFIFSVNQSRACVHATWNRNKLVVAQCIENCAI